jgi:hypothetical protein
MSTRHFFKHIGLITILIWLTLIYAETASCKSPERGLSGIKEETHIMATNNTLNIFFPIAAKQRFRSYLEAKTEILALEGEDRKQALTQLKITRGDVSDWERQLTARILEGWLERLPAFAQCGGLARGDLPGVPPLGGFNIQKRAGAIARLGKEVVPRVLEMVYKNPEYANEIEEASLYASLVYLNDDLAVMPMVILLEDQKTGLSAKVGALNVLSHFGDDRGIETAVRIANNPYEKPMLREAAIRSLSGFNHPEAATALVQILTNSAKPLTDRQVASSSLLMMGNPATRKSVIGAISGTEDQMIKLNLVGALGRIGIKDDIPLLQDLANSGEPEIALAAKDAIEEIEARE